jgi:hypothetical protein
MTLLATRDKNRKERPRKCHKEQTLNAIPIMETLTSKEGWYSVTRQ